MVCEGLQYHLMTRLTTCQEFTTTTTTTSTTTSTTTTGRSPGLITASERNSQGRPSVSGSARSTGQSGLVLLTLYTAGLYFIK